MADPISDQCYDLAIGLYACADADIKDCGKIRRLVEGLEQKLQAARAEVERLREDGNATAMDLVDERDEARADLREAMELLRAHGQPPDWLKLGDAADWNARYGKLLKKHKETK